MISHTRMGDTGKGNGLYRVNEYILTYKCHRNHKFNLWSLQNLMVIYQMKDFTSMNPSSSSAGPPLSAEQRVRSRRDDRSRSRDRVPPHSPSHASQQPQLVVPPPGVQTQGADEDSATVDPQNHVGDHSRSSQNQKDSRRYGPQPQKGKKTVAYKQPSELLKTKKRKLMDSDEDDEGPQNEPGNLFKLTTYSTSTTSSSRTSSQFTEPVASANSRWKM